MYLCYLDESGTTGTGGGDTTHFVLAGISIPIWHWRDADREVSRVLGRYGLADAELHTAWMLRKYLEQSRIPNFEQLGPADRRREVNRRRNSELTRMIQIADLCAYALRRYVENGETRLFEPIFSRADRIGEVAVGVRHFSPPGCDCAICEVHEP